MKKKTTKEAERDMKKRKTAEKVPSGWDLGRENSKIAVGHHEEKTHSFSAGQKQRPSVEESSKGRTCGRLGIAPAEERKRHIGGGKKDHRKWRGQKRVEESKGEMQERSPKKAMART